MLSPPVHTDLQEKKKEELPPDFLLSLVSTVRLWIVDLSKMSIEAWANDVPSQIPPLMFKAGIGHRPIETTFRSSESSGTRVRGQDGLHP
jgi:hypothetical protein